MILFFFSFLAGVLTVAAPCILPILPVILGTSIPESKKSKAYIITASLAVSIILFSILLKATIFFISVDPIVWKIISGGILIVMGIVYIFPRLWDMVSLRFNLSGKSDKNLEKASTKDGVLGSVLIGASLGPVFTSCSPTYSLIVATILPASFFQGLLYITAYTAGLTLTLLLITLFGKHITKRLKIFANPTGIVRKSIGILLLIVGIVVMLGIDKQIEAALIRNGNVDWSIYFENSFLESIQKK